MVDVSDNDSIDEDLEVMHITAAKEKRAQLEAERERREECIERLQAKLKALNSELAARYEEVMTLHKQNEALVQQDERESRALPSQEANGGDSPTASREVKVRSCLEQQLKERAQRRSARNEFGIRQFDEMELMVQKPQEEQKREMSYIDTVLITWSKAASSEQTYNLTYRVDRNMTSKQLREDACFYWGISEVEYILKTVTTNSKVQDDVTIQNCFRPNEDAHLMLVHKTPTKERPSEDELKAIRPKTGVKKWKSQQRKENAEDKPAAGAQSTDFLKQLDAVPGMKEFMMQCDQGVRGHLERLWLQSLCLFALLAVGTLVSILSMKVQTEEFVCRSAVHSALAAARVDPVDGQSVPAFEGVQTHQQAWSWLQHTVPMELLLPNSRLRRNNYLPGWLQLRMQQVKLPSGEQCATPGKTCSPELYRPNTAGMEDLEAVHSKWVNRTGDGRGADALPWRFAEAEAENSRTGTLAQAARFLDLDASGYVLEYNLQPLHLNVTLEAYRSDLAALHEADWISPRTRAVHVSFAAYNGNHDQWLSAIFTLEMPASGFVYPRSDVAVYKPMMTDFEWKEKLILDVVRLVMVLYLCSWHLARQLWAVGRHSHHGMGLHRLLGWCELADLTVGVLYAYIFAVRYIVLGALNEPTAKLAMTLGLQYTSVQRPAIQFQEHIVAEAFLLALVVLRLIYCCRVNRHVFILWEAMCVSARRYSSFALIFWPILLGFVVLGHAIWRSNLREYKTFWSSLTASVMLLCKDSHTIESPSSTRPLLTLFYILLFTFVMTMLFVNSWIAVVVQTYERTRVAAGYNPREYAWGEKEWVHWCLWSPLETFWKWLRPRGRGRVEKGEE